MITLGVILARAGSKGLPDKCVRDLAGRPVIAYTFDHALAGKRLTHVVLSTDSEPAKEIARVRGIEVIDRPAELAGDLVTVDAAVRHAVETWERRQMGEGVLAAPAAGARRDSRTSENHSRRQKLHGHASVDHATRNTTQPGSMNWSVVGGKHPPYAVDAVVILYGNIPIRAEGLIDRALEQLIATGADSVRSVAPVTKQHPDWIDRLDGDRMVQFRKNSIYRRQDLEPLYYHDGAVIAVTRAALVGATPNDHQSFLGTDRRAVVQRSDEAVDIDEPIDLFLAAAVLRNRTPAAPKPLLKSSGTDQGRLSIVDCRLSVKGVSNGSRRIGAGGSVFIVAEAGVNHNGSLETALQLVDAAKGAGADAVKFQMFHADALVSTTAATARYQQSACGHDSQRDMLRQLELSFEDFAAIKQRCDERGIIFLATPFGVDEVSALQRLGAPAIKIASSDLNNDPLLSAAAQAGVPVIISTGASTEEEIVRCVEKMNDWGADGRLILLHCVSAYPAPMDALNLGVIAALRDRFTVPVGFSDHSISTQTGAWAVFSGACLLEKHFTLDRKQSGPDHAMSLDPAQFAEYVREARSAQSAIGTGGMGMSPIEAEVRDIARRSVVAAHDIPAGAALTETNLTLKRPGVGLPPTDLQHLIGRRALAPIPRDTPLSWELVR